MASEQLVFGGGPRRRRHHSHASLLHHRVSIQTVQVAVSEETSHVFCLHFTLKRRAFIEEIHEKQEQVKEWLQNLGIVDHPAMVHQDDDEADDETIPVNHDESSKNRDVPSSATLPIIRPSLGRQNSISDRAKVAMQGYLNHFLGNMDIVNSREVCKFLEVSKLSFSPEYGPKLKEEYVMVKHLPKISRGDDYRRCSLCRWFSCCNDNWQKGNEEGRVSLAKEIMEQNPLSHSFKVACGSWSIRIRSQSNTKVKDWVAAINDAGRRPPEGWCHPHCYGSFATPRGLTEDGSRVQRLIDGRAAFEAIASAIEDAKSEVFICGWWLCPELYLRRTFHAHASSRLEALMEANAKQGVQIYILLYKEICFIGGLDLCFGRYDTSEHNVGDCHPLVWPGKDYYNPRESEPNSWEDTMKDELDRRKYPRMPWHDVHCALWGPPCRDIARHFVQRWNYAKRNKALNEQAIPLLIPQHQYGHSTLHGRKQRDGG
ncbi:Phospholipase [Quillaja saponaria]|uniref:Phospholipase n=1 Tax=Quillaja saponaria TaxID=32244 RepID=A0AAD7QF07_QUISA|nr:Phospholipase [Quillaja saponaria]